MKRSLVTVALIVLVISNDATLHADETIHQVTNYSAMEIDLEDVSAIELTLRSFNDPYLRFYSGWLTSDGGETFTPLDGDCPPEEWMSKHCTSSTIAGEGIIRYNLADYTEVPYTGRLVFLVSSYVGYWEVSAKEMAVPLEPESTGMVMVHRNRYR